MTIVTKLKHLTYYREYIGILLAIVVSIGVFLRTEEAILRLNSKRQCQAAISGPPISTSIAHEQTIPQAQNNHDNNIPPIPETGLPLDGLEQ